MCEMCVCGESVAHVCVGRHLTEERLEDTVGDEGVVAVAAGRPLIHLSVLRREHARVGGRGEHARVGGGEAASCVWRIAWMRTAEQR